MTERNDSIGQEAPREDAPAASEPAAGEPAASPEAPESVAEAFFPIPESELTELRKKAEERDVLWNELLRAKADLDNYQKRVRRDRPLWEEQAQGSIIGRLLPVIDDFERALEALDHEGITVESVAGGIRLALASLRKAFEDSGVEEIPALGLPFDPEIHEAVEVQASDRPEGEVLAVVQKGYRRKGGAVIRPAKVRVAKRPGGPEAAGAAGGTS
ncbi:MAG: nucleotide exchange factor GrpE [Planctomycetota bacterium]